MAKRKYARFGEKTVRDECSNRKCKWQGTDLQKKEKKVDSVMSELVCPKCGNSEFFGLLQQ